MTWSSYEPEDDGVLVAYASIHGNTKTATEKMKEILEAKGAKKVAITDLSRDDMAEAIEDAFRYDKLVLAAASYDASVFPCMETFLNKLTNKNYQNRKIAIIENGSWAPTSTCDERLCRKDEEDHSLRKDGYDQIYDERCRCNCNGRTCR